jgi:hypothetical protein
VDEATAGSGLGRVTCASRSRTHRRVWFGLSPPTIVRSIDYGPELS